jgi:hypothetical protein
MLACSALNAQGIIIGGPIFPGEQPGDQVLRAASHFVCDVGGNEAKAVVTYNKVLELTHPGAAAGFQFTSIQQSFLGSLVSGSVKGPQDIHITVGLLLPATMVQASGEPLKIAAYSVRRVQPSPFFGAPQGPRVVAPATLSPVTCEASYQKIVVPEDAVRVVKATRKTIVQPVMPPRQIEVIELDLAVESTGCTSALDFKTEILSRDRDQILSVERTKEDTCDGPLEEVSIKAILYGSAEYTPLKYKGEVVDFTK